VLYRLKAILLPIRAHRKSNMQCPAGFSRRHGTLKKAQQLRPGAVCGFKKLDGRPRAPSLLETLARPCSLAFGKNWKGVKHEKGSTRLSNRSRSQLYGGGSSVSSRSEVARWRLGPGDRRRTYRSSGDRRPGLKRLRLRPRLRLLWRLRTGLLRLRLCSCVLWLRARILWRLHDKLPYAGLLWSPISACRSTDIRLLQRPEISSRVSSPLVTAEVFEILNGDEPRERRGSLEHLIGRMSQDHDSFGSATPI
jgi:hypothetical protein